MRHPTLRIIRAVWIGFTLLLLGVFIEIILTASFAESPSTPDAGKGGPGSPKPPLSGSETLLKALGVREVREEIGLSDEQEKKIRLAGEEIREELELTLRRLIDKALDDVLTTKQVSRLKEITTQLLGVDALIDPTIAARLELSMGQVRQLKAIRLSAASEIEDAKHIFKGKEGEADRFSLEEEIRSTVQVRMLRVLTAQQKQEFEAMQGTRFAAPHIPGVNPKGPKGPKEQKEPK